MFVPKPNWQLPLFVSPCKIETKRGSLAWSCVTVDRFSPLLGELLNSGWISLFHPSYYYLLCARCTVLDAEDFLKT